MSPQKMIGFLLSLCVLPIAAAGQRNSAGPALPSLADLQQLNYQPSDRPRLSSEPSFDDLQSAILSFQTYQRGAAAVSKSGQPAESRGPIDIQIYTRTVAAVVYINAISEVQNGEVKSMEVGAGSILYPSRQILTVWHVVQPAASSKNPILVFLKPSGSAEPSKNLAYRAHIVFYNPAKDLALLEFDQQPPHQLVGLRIGNSANLQVGQDIHVIGHPKDIAWTYSTGVISQIRRGYHGELEEGGTAQPVDADMIQVQTSINPGDSGGPVMDDNGDIIGLVSFSPSDSENLHFAIGANEATGFLARYSSKQQPLARGNPDAPKGQYFRAKTSGGQEIVKVVYPDQTAYLVLEPSGKVTGLVIQAEKGPVVEAWQPAEKGGFQSWRANYADGTVAGATGSDGHPGRFVTK